MTSVIIDTKTMEGFFPPFYSTEDDTTTDNNSSKTWLTNVTSDASTDSATNPLDDAAVKLRVTFAFVTLMLATIGNGLCLAVMCRKTMRGTAAATYLSAIAVVDSFVVYFGQIPVIIRFYMPEVSELSTIWQCAFRWYFLYTSADVAVWLILALTVDRFIAVRVPSRSKMMCTHQRAVKVICGLFLFALLKNITIPVAHMPGAPTCQIRRRLEFYMMYIRPWIAFTLYALIPVISVLILNLLIIHRLVQVHRAVKTKGPGQNTISSLAGSSLTAMFLGVSIVFLVLLTPSMLNYAIMAHRPKAPWDNLITSILDSLAYINHSINFFLYCLTGRRFRKEFLSMVGTVYRNRTPDEGTSRPTTIDFGTTSNLE